MTMRRRSGMMRLSAATSVAGLMPLGWTGVGVTANAVAFYRAGELANLDAPRAAVLEMAAF